PLLLVRTLRSFAQQVKWMHMRYGPIDLASWGVFNSVYAFAEIRQLAQSKVAVYAGVRDDSTPQLEFLKGAMFSVSAPDGLLPLEVELAERLIGAHARHFVLGAAPSPAFVFWTDLAQAMTPARTSRAPQAGPGLRCFGAGAGAQDAAPRGEIPPVRHLRLRRRGRRAGRRRLARFRQPEIRKLDRGERQRGRLRRGGAAAERRLAARRRAARAAARGRQQLGAGGGTPGQQIGEPAGARGH